MYVLYNINEQINSDSNHVQQQNVTISIFISVE